MRIYIVWPGWSGKSTLAKQLGVHYNIPVIHLDELQWKTGWMENEDYGKLQANAVVWDTWIIEGSSVSILKTMKDRVDMVIILNYPPIWNIVRILKRYFKWMLFQEKRIGWAMENAHELRISFLFNTLRWRTRQLPRIRINTEECSLKGKVVEIQSIEDVFEKVCMEIHENIHTIPSNENIFASIDTLLTSKN